jgi:hypothetical protein
MSKPRIHLVVELELILRAYAQANNLSFSQLINSILYSFYKEKLKKEYPSLPEINFEIGKKGQSYWKSDVEYFAYRNKFYNEVFNIFSQKESELLKKVEKEKFVCDRCKREVEEIPHIINLPNGKQIKICEDCFNELYPKPKLEKV